MTRVALWILAIGLGGCANYAEVNKAACESWIDKMSCGSTDFSTVVNCTAYEQTTSCDISPYFDCLTSKTTCNNGQIDTSQWTSCVSLAQCK